MEPTLTEQMLDENDEVYRESLLNRGEGDLASHLGEHHNLICRVLLDSDKIKKLNFIQKYKGYTREECVAHLIEQEYRRLP